jgi:phosphinothricin acetyltransferase
MFGSGVIFLKSLRQEKDTLTLTIRLVTKQDAEKILKIYKPIVENSAISFELTPPTLVDMQQRINDLSSHFPWLVGEAEQMLLGYAYASPHRSRAAYQWSVDVSAYVHPQGRRSGIGRVLYETLFKILALQGFYNAYAGIALPNPASVGFHEALGFQKVGVYQQVGYKLGEWHDVGWWELTLQARITNPAPPSDMATVQVAPGWAALFENPVS